MRWPPSGRYPCGWRVCRLYAGTFYRIPDHTALAVENNREAVLETGHTYTAVTYNVGFGAYGPDYSFLWIQVK